MKKILISCIGVLFCASVIAQNKVNLKMNLEKNKTYRFRSGSEQTVIQTINGNQQTVDSKTSYAVSIKMIDVTSQFMVAEVHFDTLVSKTNAMGKTIDISSLRDGDIKSAETTEIMSFIMNKISKNALYVKMDFTGKVSEIVNLKMFKDVITKDTSSITLKGMAASALKTQISNMIEDKTLKTMVELYTYYLPGKEVAPGDSWDVPVNINSGGMSLDINTGYHLDKLNGNLANITAESNIKASANAGPMEANGAKITYDDIKGLSKSSMVIDIRTGLVAEEKSQSHITGTLGVSVQGMSLTIPMDINGTSNVKALQ